MATALRVESRTQLQAVHTLRLGEGSLMASGSETSCTDMFDEPPPSLSDPPVSSTSFSLTALGLAGFPRLAPGFFDGSFSCQRGPRSSLSGRASSCRRCLMTALKQRQGSCRTQ